MSSPVRYGSPVFKSVEVSVEEGKEKESKKIIEEVEVSKPSLQDEFDSLIQNYVTTLRVTEGCGSRAQGYIDTAYAKLTQFALEHPEFKSQLPKKVKCSNDGTDGMATGLATFAADSRRHGEDCVVQ